VSFSPDGATLASGSSDKTIILWDVASGKARASLRGHNAGIGVVAFSINGSILASGSSTGEVKVWHLK
jgi:WD40 repeat protein